MERRGAWLGVWVKSGADRSGVRGRRVVCEMGMMKESSLPGHAWPLRARTEVKYPLQKNIVRFVMGHPRKNVPCVQLRDSDAAEFAIVVEAGAMSECIAIRDGFCEEWIDVEYEDIEQLEIMFRVQKSGVEIGRLAILGTDLRERQGSLRKPLMENIVIGYLTIDYLVVTNLPAAAMARVEDGISNVRPPRFVGHRGSGAKGTSPYMENTVLSFINATRTADVTHVELDVQLTRDGVPVIFHDFHVPLKMKDEKPSCMVPICSMTSQQFIDLDQAVLSADDTSYLSDDDSSSRPRTSDRATFQKPRARVELGGPVKDLMPRLADICNEVSELTFFCVAGIRRFGKRTLKPVSHLPTMFVSTVPC
uniref:GP-PDE domain-containing protein n=1 Tax=Rhodosorus marinus TaxID=101924 RepID=A0A7S3A5J7_9RHOD|mmetsp:Transcript_45435/g.176688  ORF Transcript_45435/g.176688 Transcript_45435/m.176688 type:complete len:364 (+) Transcript_45435:83-1174(+)